ncbi:uncharacterized protein LOC119078380 [Bradysia coprophila]|uniref:uncharacterized protein LOC119078380 n=1 Tax=Bradysia coprophila TaxID=38358 RepID=UPI00187DB000|nr:uncharacterized protein LOC119078380 [Bradysia coprophila]
MITSGDDIVEKTFGADIQSLSVDELSRRVILASTNAVTLDINHRIMEKLDGDFVTYSSADEIISEGNEAVDGLYPVEFLNAQTPSGSPPHKLRLKVGAVVMLIRNLNKQKGLCNGTRLIVRRLHEHFIVCEIISTNHKGDMVFITRLDITPISPISTYTSVCHYHQQIPRTVLRNCQRHTEGTGVWAWPTIRGIVEMQGSEKYNSFHSRRKPPRSTSSRWSLVH